MPLSIGNSYKNSKLINAKTIAIDPVTINDIPQVLTNLQIQAPRISPTFADDAQIPINSPLPCFGNQLLIIDKFVGHPGDQRRPFNI